MIIILETRVGQFQYRVYFLGLDTNAAKLYSQSITICERKALPRYRLAQRTIFQQSDTCYFSVHPMF